MKREQVLAVLYDLTLTIGGEVRLDALLSKVLQRLLFHTSFPAGLVLTPTDVPGEARLVAVVGDHVLAQAQGQTRALPPHWLDGHAELMSDPPPLPWGQGSRPYSHVLRLPFRPEGLILLMSPQPPLSELSLTEVFRPALRNLAKAASLCRHSEQYTRSLISDRDQARSDLASALRRSETERIFLRQLTNTFPDLVWLKNPEGVYLACNRPFERLFGAPEADILGKTDRDFVPEALADLFRKNDLATLASNAPHVNEEWLTFRADGYQGLFETTKVPMRDPDGHVLGVLGVARDITQRRRDEAQLHLAASVFTHAREGILITRADGTILDVNHAFSQITGYARQEALESSVRRLAPDPRDRRMWHELRSTLRRQGHWSGEVWSRRKDGLRHPLLVTVSAVGDDQFAPLHYVALCSDISRIKEHEQQLEQIAHYDALTGLPNRVLFADRLQQAMAQSHRRQNLLAVAFIDLDGFKEINDRHGHVIGDRFLAELAQRMKAHLREGDTLARLGGDEFAATFLDLGSVDDGRCVLSRLLAATAQPVVIDGLALQCTASIGLTFHPQPEAVDADQLLRQADQAMYQAKLAGKNRHQVFDPEQDRSVRGQHGLIERLRAALAAEEFRLHYQPKVNMRSGRVVGAEALIRWQHPERGLLAPGAFLPATENHPISVALGDWVVEAALSQMGIWARQGLTLPVSVNVSPMQLQDPNFVSRLGQLLARHPDVPPSMLELEILETSALQDAQQIGQVLRACRQMGLTCALDDFGTGYSTLSYLKRLPADVLKIDQSFVRDMLDDPDDLAILEGVLGLARAFHRQAVAEGVETVEHGVALLQLGCELAQGYGIARPMPPTQLEEWLGRWHPPAQWQDTAPLRPDDLPWLYAQVEIRGSVNRVTEYVEGRRATVPDLLSTRPGPSGEGLDRIRDATGGPLPAFNALYKAQRRLQDLSLELIEGCRQGKGAQSRARLPELHALSELLLDRLIELKPAA